MDSLEPSLRRKSTPRKVGKLGSNRAVTFSNGAWHHVKNREKKGPSQGIILKVQAPRTQSVCAKFEDRTVQETLQQERCARRGVWDLAKHVYELKTRDKVTFYFPTRVWVVPASSAKNPEEREFVIDSDASMHMLSKKDFSSAELETLQTTMITGNGEVQTSEEAQVHVHDLHLFVTVQILDEHACSLVIGQALRRTRLYFGVGPVVKSHIWPWMGRILCNAEIFVAIVAPGLSSSSSTCSSSTSLPQDTSSTSPSPARLRSDDTHAQASGDRGDHHKISKILEEGQHSSNKKSIARLPRVVTGVYRQSRRYRRASSRKHFSRLRFGT